jgi:hypothetical protein
MANIKLAVGYRSFVEFVSTIAVMLGLVFVGYNIQRSTSIASADAVFALNNSMNRKLQEIALDPAVADIFIRASSDLESLSFNERFRYDLWIRTFLNLNESAWLFHKKGVIDDEEYAGWREAICLTLLRPGFREYMTSRIETYAEGFVEDINNRCPG